MSVVSLRACGTQSTTAGTNDYPQPKDNPFGVQMQIERAEDSLQFHIEEDILQPT